MNDDLAWLGAWQGDFDVATLLNAERWERYRANVQHPTTLFTAPEIEAARHNAAHTAWGAALRDQLLAEVEALGMVDAAWAERYVPAITPYAPHFTMCPRCEFAPMHGAYAWSPAEPDLIRCQGCGTVYPNADYPEDLVFQSRYDPTQVITLYGGKSWPAYGYAAIHSSFSGHARIHQCRYAANGAEKLALAYAITGEACYGRAAAAILRRFAQVHPHYLVHSAYGDIADMDPKIAATHVNNLPEDEWCPPGNVPDRKLYPGYWMVMRWGSSAGMEGTSLHKLILAYDLVASTLDDADRRFIERDLLLDAAPLFFADPTINNKTGMNRSAVALIGVVCGDPLLVRFGLDGFVRAVRDWWLPDGGTPESLGYSSMMLHGVWRIAEALRHYSDPPDLDLPGVDLPPVRLDKLDLYEWPRYRAVWQGMARTLLPNLEYPLLADNRKPCHLSPMLATVLARAYPSERHTQLRDAIQQLPRCYAGRIAQFWYGAHLDSAPLFYRAASNAVTQSTPPAFASDLGPHLNIGTLRSGVDGRQSALILSAADWKGHHHFDHLNLYYWREDQEWLTDLGYLWDMEDVNPKVKRTFAHHLVVVDESEQRSKGRQGTFHLFHADPAGAQVMEASSNVYEAATTYRRTVAILGQGEHEIVVDIFRVEGGTTHDWVLHGPHNHVQVEGLSLAPHYAPLYDLQSVQTATSTGPWVASWGKTGEASFRVHLPGSAGETVYIGQGFGQRAAHDRAATVPYVVRRRVGGPSVFVTVYSVGDHVRAVRVPHCDEATLNVVVQIATAQGTSTVVSLGPERNPLRAEIAGTDLTCDGAFAARTPTGATLIGGTRLVWGNEMLAQPAGEIGGEILGSFVQADQSGLVVAGDPAHLSQLVGYWIAVTTAAAPERVRWFPVLAVEVEGDQCVLVTRRMNEGYDIEVEGAGIWYADLACSAHSIVRSRPPETR